MEQKNCQECGNVLVGKYQKKFCSSKCSAANASRFSVLVTKIDKTFPCGECGKSFERQDRRSKFCSRSCSAKYHNRIRSSEARHSCLGCDKQVLRRVSYCSPECRTSHKISLWLQGEFEATQKYTLSKFIRDYLIQESGYACQKCGYNRSREDGSSILQIHHIDGNWKNNRPENLECLCPNCHALTDNFGAKNMGNGRAWKQDYNQFAGLAER